MQFHSTRDEALDIALSVGQKLQSALDSAKHGFSASSSNSYTMSTRDILYGDIADVKTITVDNNTTRLMVLFKWYSMCNVKLKDIYSSISSKQFMEIRISRIKMDLYVLDAESISRGIFINNKDVRLKQYQDLEDDGIILYVSNPPPDILNRIVRKTSLDCYVDDWEVKGESDTIYTIFSGNKFENVMMYVHDTLSTDVSITVSYMGKVNASLLYDKYISEPNANIYIASIFCSRASGCNVYSSVSINEPIKRMCVREQVNTLVSSSLDRTQDNLSSIESRLVVGLNVGND